MKKKKNAKLHFIDASCNMLTGIQKNRESEQINEKYKKKESKRKKKLKRTPHKRKNELTELYKF